MGPGRQHCILLVGKLKREDFNCKAHFLGPKTIISFYPECLGDFGVEFLGVRKNCKTDQITCLETSNQL